MALPCRDLLSAGCLSRRRFLHLGGLAAAGALSNWPALQRAGAAARRAPAGRARACIFLYLLGGPPHLDMWDLKPKAPAEIRGPFRPIPTRVPGLEICEHLPRLAQVADKFALLRAVSHPNNNHTPMIYYTLTGHQVEDPSQDNDLSPPRRADFPHIGSVVARLRPPVQRLPGFVALPEVASRINGSRPSKVIPLRGGRAGFLGAGFDPLCIDDDPRTPEAIPGLSLPAEVAADRFQARQALLGAVEGRLADAPATRDFGELRRLAVHLTGSAQRGPGVYALAQEPAVLRERYGRHRFGQSLLLARRLTEAGVPLVAIHFNDMTRCDGWDTHGQNFAALKDELLPLLDQGLSALLEDLDQRGTLEETLVVCLGEFGRTPKINGNAGRDHWGHCQTALLAGGGIRAGQVYGASDKDGAYPRDGKVDPVDIHATIYRCLGIDPEQEIHDHLNRPQPLCTGRAIERLIG
jgi:hypothetical protein